MCSPVIGAMGGAPFTPRCRMVILSWVARSRRPALRMPPAISSNSFARRLVLFFFAIVHLLYQAFSDRKRERPSIGFEPDFRDVARRGELVLVNLRARAFGEAE